MQAIDQSVRAFVELVVSRFQLTLKHCYSTTICRAGGYGVEDDARNAADDVDEGDNYKSLHKLAALLRSFFIELVRWIVERSEYLAGRRETPSSLRSQSGF